jgi:UDP-glucose 4-epimerase
MTKKQKTIVTGALGNLGSHLLKYNCFDFIPVSRDETNLLENIPKDSVNSIIHCAYDLKNDINSFPEKVLESNVLSVGKMLEKSKELGVKNFIFISSCSVYGESSNSSEEKLCSPITINGFTKMLGEEVVKSFCTKNDINYLVLRVFNSYGGNDNFSVINKIIKCAQNGTIFNLSNEGIAERDFIHIDDVAHIVCQLALKNLKNETVNVGTGVPVKIIDVIHAIETRTGKLQINHNTNNNETIYSRANVKKLKHIIDYKFINIFDYINKL